MVGMRGLHSPWGTIQSSTELAPGIVSVDTPSHGGIHLSRERQRAMPAALKLKTPWYEEDLEYNRVLLAFPDLFKPEQVEKAHETLRDWHPDVYQAWTGKEVKPEESRVLRERLFKEANKDNYIVLAAWGSWNEKVPKGFVGVFAGKGGRQEDGMYPPDCKYFLVPDEEYHSGDFVVDPARHKEVESIS